MFHNQESSKPPQPVLRSRQLWPPAESDNTEQKQLNHPECMGGADFVNYQIPETTILSRSSNEQPKSEQSNPPLQAVRLYHSTRFRGRERYRSLNGQQKFLVFVKILFKVLEAHNEFDKLRRAKAVVSHCAQRNRMGDTSYAPLKEVTTICLRQTVGESYWSLATSYFIGA